VPFLVDRGLAAAEPRTRRRDAQGSDFWEGAVHGIGTVSASDQRASDIHMGNA